MQSWRKNFFILWSGEAISVLTSSILQMALIWYITFKTGSAAMLSIASVAGYLPSALLGPFAGSIVDRFSRKASMIAADLFIAAVSLALVFASIICGGDIPIWLIFVVLALRSLGTAFHTPSISATTPLIVPIDELTKCAGYTQTLQMIGNLAGIAIAGAIYSFVSISFMVALDVAGALIATLAVVLVKIPPYEKSAPSKKQNILQDTIQGFKVMRADKTLFAILITAILFHILYSPIEALYSLITTDYYGGTPLMLSFVQIAFSAGMLICGLLMSLTGGIKNRGKEIIFSVILIGVPIALSGVLPKDFFWVFVACCAVMGFSAPIYNVPVTALMQERVSPEYLGRVFGLFGSVVSLAMPIGLALSGTFADAVGINNWFLLTGILITLLGFVMCAIPSLRNVDKK